jgi:hypothetical protein
MEWCNPTTRHLPSHASQRRHFVYAGTCHPWRSGDCPAAHAHLASGRSTRPARPKSNYVTALCVLESASRRNVATSTSETASVRMATVSIPRHSDRAHAAYGTLDSVAGVCILPTALCHGSCHHREALPPPRDPWLALMPHTLPPRQHRTLHALPALQFQNSTFTAMR